MKFLGLPPGWSVFSRVVINTGHLRVKIFKFIFPMEELDNVL